MSLVDAAAKNENSADDLAFSKEIQASLDQAFEDRFPKVPNTELRAKPSENEDRAQPSAAHSESRAKPKFDYLQPAFGREASDEGFDAPGSIKRNRPAPVSKNSDAENAPEAPRAQEQQAPAKPAAQTAAEREADQPESKPERRVEVEKKVEVEKSTDDVKTPGENAEPDVKPVKAKEDSKPEAVAETHVQPEDNGQEPQAQDVFQDDYTGEFEDASSLDEGLGDLSNREASFAADEYVMNLPVQDQEFNEAIAAKNREWGNQAHITQEGEGIYHLFVNPKAEAGERFDFEGLSDEKVLSLKGLQGQKAIPISVEADRVSVNLTDLDSESKKLALQATLEVALTQSVDKTLTFTQLPETKEDKAILAEALLRVQDEIKGFQIGDSPQAKDEFIDALAKAAAGRDPEEVKALAQKFANGADGEAFMDKWSAHAEKAAAASMSVETGSISGPSRLPQGEPADGESPRFSFQETLPGMTQYVVSAAPAQHAAMQQDHNTGSGSSNGIAEPEPGMTQYLIQVRPRPGAASQQENAESAFLEPPSGESINGSSRSFQGISAQPSLVEPGLTALEK